MASTDRTMYELMYVVNTVLNDDQIKDIVNRVSAFIRENDGDIVEVDEKGSQRLAYPIEKKRNGHYAVVYFRSEPAFIEKFERALKRNDDILRRLLLRYDAKMERHYEARQSQPAEAEAEAEA